MAEKFTRDEEVAFRYLFKERLPVPEAAEKLRKDGFDFTEAQLRAFKKRAFKILLQQEKDEHLAELLLDSFDRIRIEFEALNEKTKALLADFEREGKKYAQLDVIRELREQLTLAMKRLGELQAGIKNITVQKQNILNIQEFVLANKRMREQEFEEQGWIEKNGMLIVTRPSPELLDDYYRWRRKRIREKGRIEVGPQIEIQETDHQ